MLHVPSLLLFFQVAAWSSTDPTAAPSSDPTQQHGHDGSNETLTDASTPSAGRAGIEPPSPTHLIGQLH